MHNFTYKYAIILLNYSFYSRENAHGFGNEPIWKIVTNSDWGFKKKLHKKLFNIL